MESQTQQSIHKGYSGATSRLGLRTPAETQKSFLEIQNKISASLKAHLFNEYNSTKPKFQKLEVVINWIEQEADQLQTSDLELAKEYLLLLKYTSITSEMNNENISCRQLLNAIKNTYIDEANKFENQSLTENLYPWTLRIKKHEGKADFIGKLIYFDQNTKDTPEKEIKKGQLFFYYTLSLYGQPFQNNDEEWTVLSCLELEKHYRKWVQQGYLHNGDTTKIPKDLADAWLRVQRNNFQNLLFKSTEPERDKKYYGIKIPKSQIKLDLNNLEFLKRN